MPDVFISHATEDDAAVAVIRKGLEGQRLFAWVDSRQLAGGDSLVKELREAIAGSQHFVAVLSKNAMNSSWVRMEIEHALEVRKERRDGFRVILLLLPGIELVALHQWFGEETVGVTVQIRPRGIQAALPDLLAALGKALPGDREPPQPKATPLADLVLELGKPVVEEVEGKSRATADAKLIYRPADGSPPVASEPFCFRAPLGAIEAEEIAWYLERYVRWPSGPFVERAQQVEARLPEWGKALFAGLSVEAARRPLEDWRAAGGVSRRFTVEVDPEPVVGSTEEEQEKRREATAFLALPWELLHDDRGYLFQGAKGVRVRRRLPNRHPRELLLTEAPLRVLLVSPRPEDESPAYIDHRASAKPLAEALADLGDLARLTLLAPPTFPALAAELERARKAGMPYHVVHFDGHGVYDRRQGLGALCFEHPEDEEKLDQRRSEIVDAERIAEVVRDHRVPLFFLEACQSAMTRLDPTASVAGKLLQWGVASVAAMSHSVLAETARRFVGVFYKELAAGRRIGEAMLAGQRALRDDTFRGKTFSGDLHLQDWFVPVLFQEEADSQLVREVPAAKVQSVLAAQHRHELGDLPHAPGHTFVGRSRNLLRAERLLARETYVVLRGNGGEGKTMLGAELARWLVMTERVGCAAFASLKREGSAQSLLLTLGNQLTPGFATEAASDEGRALLLLKRALGDEPTVLLIDNVESVLPAPGAAAGVANGDEAEVLTGILAVLERLGRVKGTRLVFTSREALPPPFERNHLTVGRLDREHAIALVGRVLKENDPRPRADDAGDSEEEIEALVDAAQGHARSLVLLAREVAGSGVRRTTAEFHELMARLEWKHPGDRERSLFASVELSLRRLPSKTRRKIYPLGVFQGGGQLGVIAAVLGLDTEKDEEIVLADQLASVGLAERLPYGYLRLDPALGPALLAEMSAEERQAARAAWAEATAGLVGFLYEEREREPQAAAALTLLDLPNLLAALEELSRRAEPDLIVNAAAAMEALLSNLGRPKALARVIKAREAAAGRLEAWSHARYLARAAALERLLEAGRYAESIVEARALLVAAAAMGEEPFPEAAYDLAMCHKYLGQALLGSGNAGAALLAYEEADGRFRKLVEAGNAGAARMVSRVLVPKGDCLTALGRLDEAARACEEAIGLAEARGERREVAIGKFHLGTVRLFQGRFAEALAAYYKARETFEALGEPGNVAVAWHQIGNVHQEAGEPEAAERAYLAALDLETRLGDRAGEASTLGQLGILYQGMNRLEDSVRFSRKAAEIHVSQGDLAGEGRARSNAAVSLLALVRHDEARRELLRAIECDEPFGHAAEPWKAFALLEELERAADNSTAAGEARAKAIQAFLAYRRAGGENQTLGGRLCTAAAQALAGGETAAGPQSFSELLQRPDLPASVRALLPALQAVLTGSRDPSLGEDPDLTYHDAAELILLLESLDSRPSPALRSRKYAVAVEARRPARGRPSLKPDSGPE